LASVAALRCRHEWELVIVDNGSSDDTALVIEEFGRESQVTVSCVREPSVGLGHARNAGVAIATGRLVAFIDDDCYPEPELLEAIASVFDDPRIGFMGGRVKLHDPMDAPITIRDDDDTEFFAPFSVLPTGRLHGACMAFRRSVLEQIGGFDPLFGAGTRFPCEDVDALARAAAAGWAGGYFPAPTISHHHGRRRGPRVDALDHSYDVGRGAYIAKRLGSRQTRLPYLRYWGGRIRWQHPSRTMREVRGAVLYALLRLRNLGCPQARRGCR